MSIENGEILWADPTTLSPGEAKAIQREKHLCGYCAHAAVCKIAAAIDPQLLVIISQCLAFEPPASTGEAS